MNAAAALARVVAVARRWRHPVVLYALFGGVSFLLFWLATFPYDTLKQRLAAEAAKQGWYFRAASIGPAFLGVRARGVELSALADARSDKTPTPVRIDSLTLSPSLFPWGFAFSADISNGSVSGSISQGSELRAHLTARNVDLAHENLTALTGVQGTGKLKADLELTVPTKKEGPDVSGAQGKLTLHGDDLGILGGAMTVPVYGTPTEVTLPRATLGALDLEVQIEDGTGTLQRLSVTGDDLQLSGSGTVRLDRRIPLSNMNIQLGLSPGADFQKRLGLLGSGLTLLPADPSRPGWRTAKVTGLLGHPNLSGGR